MIYILNRREEVVAVLGNSPGACHYDRDYFTERLENGMLLHEFECPADHEDAAHIDTDGHIAIKDKKGRLVIFKIREIQDVRDATSIKRRVYSEGKHLDLIGHVVRPIMLEGVSAETALTHVLSGTGWEPGTIEWSGINTFDFKDYPSALAAVLQISESYPAEILFRVELKNGRITRKYVDMLQIRGTYNGARFEYGQNVLSITRKRHRTDLITAIIGVGKADPNGVEATFKDISYSFTNEEGTTVTKPVGQDWIGDPDAFQRWSENGKHITGVFKTEESDPLVILKESWKMLQARKAPRLSYEMDVALLETEVDVGDTVIGKDDMFEPPLLVSARVVEYKQSQTDSNNDKVVLANFMELSESTGLSALRDLIRRKQAEWESGGEIIYKGNQPPDDPFDGMLWLDTTKEPNVLYRWDAQLGKWVKASPTEPGDIGAETPEETQEKIEEFTLQYAERKISKGPNPPSAPEQYDLWIDTSVNPPVWKQYTGTEWKTFTRTNLSELLGTIKTVQIDDDAITNAKIAAEAVTGAEIKSRSITAGKLVAGTITAYEIAAKTITASEIAARTISANEIKSGSITAFEIAANTITTNLISTAGLDAGVIKTGYLSADRINGGTISGVNINVNTNVSIGNKLIIDPSNFNAGVQWGQTGIGTGKHAEIYIDPVSNALFISNSKGGAIYAGNQRIDTAPIAKFG